MLNKLVKFLFGKELIVYNKHRNTLPLVNEINRRKYVFINYLLLWKSTRIFGRNTRWRYRAMAVILSFIQPLYIIDINWTAKLNRLYHVWCGNNRPCKFIVVQHGLYIAGIITDKAHKFSKCDIIFCWGKYSLNEFKKYNSQKNVEIVLWGNSLYNQYDRKKISFKKNILNRVLVVPTVIKGERKQILEDFMVRLHCLGFNVSIKEHSYQAKLSEPIAGFPKIQGALLDILLQQKFDIIVSDTSTSLVDALYFKNRTLFFSPEGDSPEYTHNAYADYLRNIATIYQSFSRKEDVLSCIDLDAQEKLLENMVTIGDNDLAKLC